MSGRAEFEHILVVELGREAFATTAEMTRIIRRVVESGEVRSILDDHSGSQFQQWRALFRLYPEMVAVRVEDWLGYHGYPLSQRLTREAFAAWRSSVRKSVERAAEKAGLAAAQ